MTGRTLALSLLLGAATLGGCGKMGELERPAARGTAAAPSPGDATASGQQRNDNGDPNTGSQGAVNVNSDENRSVDPAPSRTLPIDGMAPNPSEVAPPGALPDPYANPQ